MTAPDGRLIMLSAGEASGDLHGATMSRALRSLDPSVRLIGMGGPRMAAAGVEILVDPTAHAAVGTSEAIGRVPGLVAHIYEEMTQGNGLRRLAEDEPEYTGSAERPLSNA